jgi:hypothetical protein
MGTLASLLTRVNFQGHETPAVAVDPATRFVFLAGPNGVERVDSAYRKVAVPMFDWQKMGVDEDAEIIKVLVEAAGTNPLKIVAPSKVDDIFWVKNRGWKAVLFNPALSGKFFIPDDLLIYTSALVPENQLLLVGLPNAVGFYAVQGNTVGVVSNKRQGLLQIQFLVV